MSLLLLLLPRRPFRSANLYDARVILVEQKAKLLRVEGLRFLLGLFPGGVGRLLVLTLAWRAREDFLRKLMCVGCVWKA